MLLQKTQLYNSCKWTFDLTIHNLIGILDVPLTSSPSYHGVVLKGVQYCAHVDCKKII